MITKFKIFENNNSVYKEDDYIGKFSIIKSDVENIKFVIALCNRIDFNKNLGVYIEYECFDVDKDDNIIDPAGDNEYVSIEDLNKINFMTATELYYSNKDICEKLYNKIREYFKNEYLEYWIGRFVIHYKRELETIPDFKFFADSDKFNI